uniref:Dirigent protein n=1 Tax=Oryza brachyantha TaxID=4533 RepID=J3N6G1_ORYBR
MLSSFLLLLCSSYFLSSGHGEGGGASCAVSAAGVRGGGAGGGGGRRLTKFKVYFHDVVGGPKPTAIRVAQAPSTNGSSTFFGAVVAIDDPLTSAAASGSAEVGRAQGS